MSGHAILPILLASGGSTLAMLINFVGRGGRRAIFLIIGSLLIGVGLGAPYLVHASVPVVRWTLTGVGALLLFAAGPGWRNLEPVTPDDAGIILKPATGRPLRHFGEAP